MDDPTVPSGDMPIPPLDPDTADRLLAGSVHPDDAPDGYRRVAALIAAARQPAAPAERVEPPAGLAELVVASPPAPEPAGRSRAARRRRFATVAVATAVLVGASSAAAATNNLPAPIQRAVSSLGSHLGLSIPTPQRPVTTAPSPTDPTTGPDADPESPSVLEPGDLVDGSVPDPRDVLPVDPGPVDDLVPQPLQPVPGGPAPAPAPCEPGQVPAVPELCVPVEQPPLDPPPQPPLDPSAQDLLEPPLS